MFVVDVSIFVIDMGKGRKSRELPFSLRFEPPNARAGAAGSAAGGNPLRHLFPDMSVEVLDEVLSSSGGDEEAATARVIEMYEARFPSASPDHTGGTVEADTAGARSGSCEERTQASREEASRAVVGVFEMLPDDLLLKLMGSAFFRPIDLLVAAHTCRKWRHVIAEIMASIASADLCHRSDRMNLALLRACRNAKTVRIRGPFRAFLHVQRNAPCLGAGGHAVTLTHLKLVKCDNLSDEMVTGMLTSMPALSSLEIDSCGMVTDGAFNDLWEQRMLIDMGETTGELMAKLQQLDITNCALVTGQAVKYAIMALCGGGTSAGGKQGGRCLESLKFGGNGPLGQEPILLAARRLKRVHIKDASSFTSLALVACDSLLDFTLHNSLQVRNIVIEAPQLKVLALTGCKMLLRVKVDSRKQLEALSLHGCRALDHLDCPSPLLSSLNMYGCLAAGDVSPSRPSSSSTPAPRRSAARLLLAGVRAAGLSPASLVRKSRCGAGVLPVGLRGDACCLVHAASICVCVCVCVCVCAGACACVCV